MYASIVKKTSELKVNKLDTGLLWVFYDLDPRSFDQSHWQKKCVICVQSIIFFELRTIESFSFTQIAYDLGVL